MQTRNSAGDYANSESFLGVVTPLPGFVVERLYICITFRSGWLHWRGTGFQHSVERTGVNQVHRAFNLCRTGRVVKSYATKCQIDEVTLNRSHLPDKLPKISDCVSSGHLNSFVCIQSPIKS
jgi:hypothetical protein